MLYLYITILSFRQQYPPYSDFKKLKLILNLFELNIILNWNKQTLSGNYLKQIWTEKKNEIKMKTNEKYKTTITLTMPEWLKFDQD